LRLWRVAVGSVLSTFAEEIGRTINNIAFSPDGTSYGYTRSDGTVVLARTSGTTRPRITAFTLQPGFQVELHWTGTPPVWVDFCPSLEPGSSWQQLGGPVTNSPWSGTVPVGATNGFLRLRAPAP
jgi:hypothetical protein